MKLVLLTLVALVAVTPAAAQTVDVAQAARPEVKTTDPVVVTATKVETPESHLGAAVTVITEDDVRTHNYFGIEDALRNVPGVVSHTPVRTFSSGEVFTSQFLNCGLPSISRSGSGTLSRAVPRLSNLKNSRLLTRNFLWMC